MGRKHLQEEGLRGKLLSAGAGRTEAHTAGCSGIWKPFVLSRQRCVHTQACLLNVHSFYLGTIDRLADCGHGGVGGAGVGGRQEETGEVATVVVYSQYRVTEGPPGGHSCRPSSKAQNVKEPAGQCCSPVQRVVQPDTPGTLFRSQG